MRSKTIGLAALGFGLSCTGSFSADLAPPALTAPFVPGLLDGFYLRVDGGVGFNQRPRLTTLPNPVGTPAGSLVDPGYGGVFTSSTYSGSRLSETAFGGLGIGYRFSPWLRFDVTGEYRAGSKLTASNVLDDVGATGPFGALASSHSAVSNFSGRLSSAVFLANGYVDLGDYWGFTPFVGAGVGVASNYVSRLIDSGVYTTRIDGLPPFSIATDAFLPARNRTEFAWALMGGVAYDIAPNLKLEVGYRYLDMGGYRSGTEHLNLPNGVLATPYYGQSRVLAANEIKVGLRWSFVTAGASEPPLARRY